MRKKSVWLLMIIFCIQAIAVYGDEQEAMSVTAVDGANPTLLISSPVEAEGSTAADKKTEPQGADTVKVEAKSAVLIDAGTGTVLYEKSAHDQLPPASVTKVMTMLLVMEAIEAGQITLQDSVTISERAASMGGSQLFMEPGEQQTVETLMKGISIASANAFCDKPRK